MGSRSFTHILVPDSLPWTGSKGTASRTDAAPRTLPGTDESVLLCSSLSFLNQGASRNHSSTPNVWDRGVSPSHRATWGPQPRTSPT